MNERPIQWGELPSSDKDAARRFEKYKDKDPFPEIAPALLNSADIFDYACATGMIYPFEQERLKPASYEAQIGDTFVIWRDAKKEVTQLTSKGEFILPPNSIGFVTIKQSLRLPEYIATRFNLRISNVHKGLLLGTGPLVDPGFEGNLLIPLHNLTNQTYHFRREDNFIWVEFTKISDNDAWKIPVESIEKLPRQGTYKPFPDAKKWLTVDQYLNGLTVESSIPESVQHAEDTANKVKRLVLGFGVVSTIIIILMIAGLVFQGWSLVGGTRNLGVSIGASLEEVRKDISEIRKSQSLSDRRAEEENANSQTRINELWRRIDALSSKIGKMPVSSRMIEPERARPSSTANAALNPQKANP